MCCVCCVSCHGVYLGIPGARQAIQPHHTTHPSFQLCLPRSPLCPRAARFFLRPRFFSLLSMCSFCVFRPRNAGNAGNACRRTAAAALYNTHDDDFVFVFDRNVKRKRNRIFYYSPSGRSGVEWSGVRSVVAFFVFVGLLSVFVCCMWLRKNECAHYSVFTRFSHTPIQRVRAQKKNIDN